MLPVNLAPLPFQAWAKENVRMFATDQSFVEETLFVKPTITDPFVLVQKAFLVTLKMTRLAARRNFAPPMLTALETTFVWISDALLHSDQLAVSIENVPRMKSVQEEIVSIPAKEAVHVVSMLSAQFSTTTSNALVLKDSQAMLKLNVSGFLILACLTKDALEE